MRIGTKSLLFGVHQVFWHPVTVLLAWRQFYGWPSWRELVCIVVHDWGYWGAPNMDGTEGERHVTGGARIAGALLGREYYELCLLHSRHYARKWQLSPSRLCWADKLSLTYDPWWFYLPRAWLTGELFEYRHIASNAGFISLRSTHREWFAWARDYLRTIAHAQKPDVLPYANPRTEL